MFYNATIKHIVYYLLITQRKLLYTTMSYKTLSFDYLSRGRRVDSDIYLDHTRTISTTRLGLSASTEVSAWWYH